MENKEFNLSEKIKETNVIGEYFIPKHIREFINKLKKLYFLDNKILFANIVMEIDKLAGDKLI